MWVCSSFLWSHTSHFSRSFGKRRPTCKFNTLWKWSASHGDSADFFFKPIPIPHRTVRHSEQQWTQAQATNASFALCLKRVLTSVTRLGLLSQLEFRFSIPTVSQGSRLTAKAVRNHLLHRSRWPWAFGPRSMQANLNKKPEEVEPKSLLS